MGTSDRFGLALCCVGQSLYLSHGTTFHLQTDGQTEHTIHTLADMFRASVINIKGNLVDQLPLIKFAYNSNCHSRIQMVPYETLYGRRCKSHIGWF